MAAIRSKFDREVWAAVAIKLRGDVEKARDFAGAASLILYDAKTPDDASLPGGMGLRFDWSLLDGVRHPLRWALSGGLDAGNVAEAICRTGAPLVDVSSGVESAPGVRIWTRSQASLKPLRQISDRNVCRGRPGNAQDKIMNAPIPSAPSPTSVAISATMAAAMSPRR